MRVATWADLDAVDYGLGPPTSPHGHPLYIRTKREYDAVLRRAVGLGPVRVAPDICGTLLRGSPLKNQITCDPTLPVGAMVPR